MQFGFCIYSNDILAGCSRLYLVPYTTGVLVILVPWPILLLHDKEEICIKRVAARELRSLSILASELITNAVQELDIALLWVLFQGCYEGPGHGASGLGSNRRIG